MSEDEKKMKQSKKAKTNGTVGLFDPMTLRGVTVRNRIWLPPMDTYSALAQDGLPTPFHYQHYVSRAMGGFGMIIMEATAVAPEGRISPCDLGLWADEQMDAWRWIVADTKAAGATMAVQLNHAGRKASTGCFSIGFERVCGILLEQGYQIPGAKQKIALLYGKDADFPAVLSKAAALRDTYNVTVLQQAKKLGKQLGQLEAAGFAGAAFMDKDEVKIFAQQ